MKTQATPTTDWGKPIDAQEHKEILADFPILNQRPQEEGQTLVFLDSAASSQKPRQVIEAIRHYYSQEHANIHRGAYALSYQATEKYEQSRQEVAKLLQASHSESCIFTRNATEAINLVAYTWGTRKCT